MRYPNLTQFALFTLSTILFSCNNTARQKVITAKPTTKTAEIVSLPIQESKRKGKKNFASQESNRRNTNYVDVNTIFISKQEKEQSFLISTSQQETIKCERGTKITLPPRAFANKRTGKIIDGNVQVQVAEFYDKEDFILANLSTTSDGKLLESGGTIYITAYSTNGEECKLAKNKSIKIQFPFDKKKQGMQLFYGQKTKNGINWKLPETAEKRNNSQAKTTVKTKSDSPKEKVYTVVERQAQFPGGEQALINFLGDNIDYPKEAKEQGLEEVVLAEFAITETGKVEEIKIVRSNYPILAAEVTKALQTLPDFLPARNNGKAMKSYFTLPINFEAGESGNIRTARKLVVRNGRVDFSTNHVSCGKLVSNNIAKANNLNEVSMNEVGSYILRSAQLGWINCDRFYLKKQKINYAIKTQVDNVNIKLIFKSINGVMSGKYSHGRCTFTNVPINEEVTIFALKNENERYYFASEQTTIRNSLSDVQLVYTPIDKSNLDAIINDLNLN